LHVPLVGLVRFPGDVDARIDVADLKYPILEMIFWQSQEPDLTRNLPWGPLDHDRGLLARRQALENFFRILHRFPSTSP
jgi:hypothetical protein